MPLTVMMAGPIALAGDGAGAAGVVAWACMVTLGMLVLAGCLAAGRAVVGPTLADRVIALDLLSALVVGGIIVVGVLEAAPVLLWVSIVMALLMYLSTVAFSYYLMRRGRP